MPLIVQQGFRGMVAQNGGASCVALCCLGLLSPPPLRASTPRAAFLDCIYEDSWKRNAIIRRERPHVKDIHTCVAALLGSWCCGMKCFAEPPFSIVSLLYLAAGEKTVQDCFLWCVNRCFRYIFGRRSIRRGSVRSRCLWRIW